MCHHSSSVNGEGTSHKDPLFRVLDELSSLKLWKEKLEIKEKGKEGRNKSRWERKNKSFEYERKMNEGVKQSEEGCVYGKVSEWMSECSSSSIMRVRV